MRKCIKDVISYLMVRFPESVKNYYYDNEADIYIVEHNIDNLLEDSEFQEIVFSNLFDNNIYNIIFEYYPERYLERKYK